MYVYKMVRQNVVVEIEVVDLDDQDVIN